MRVHVILLAAGNSRRFGSNKLLAEIDKKPMYLHIKESLKHAAVSGTHIIVSQYEEILQKMEHFGYLAVKNEHPELGISRSISLGIQKLKENGLDVHQDAVCFFVCDQPYLQAETIRALLHGFAQSGKGIGCLAFEGEFWNPVVFHAKYLKELLALSGDVGGKRVVKKHLDDVYSYLVVDGRELEDIDYCREIKYEV